VDEPTPNLPPARPAPRRSRRFTLPVDHHDTRTNERIEAFIEGSARPVRKRTRAEQRRPHRPIVFDSALDWEAAMRREDVRVERYGRRATVVVVDVAPVELIGPVVEAIRHEARETDRVARVGAGRFRLLLPETGEADADRFVERLSGACRDRLNGHGSALRMRVESATPGHGRSLGDALAEAEERLET
jgi:hypothetical protein